MLTQARLKEFLHYDPETGIFTWKVSRTKRAGRTQIGDIAGDIDKLGYGRVGIESKRYKTHRLAWFYMTGEWPIYDIDHINGNTTDNSFNNLRDICKSANMQNQRKARKDNSTGYLGVEYNKTNKKFIASISIKGRKTHLGCFATAELAYESYLNAKRMHHSGCTI